MRWKSNKTKPVKDGLQDEVVIMDILGHFHFNVPLTGWGKDAKIGGKSWNEIKDAVAFWQYMTVLRQELADKLVLKWAKLVEGRTDYVRGLPKGFELFGDKNDGLSLEGSDQDKIQSFLQEIGAA